MGGKNVRPLVAFAATLAVACGMGASPPGDEELRTRFRADRAAFEAMLGSLRRSPVLTERGSWKVSREDVVTLGLPTADAEAVGTGFDRLGLPWVKGESGPAGPVVFVTWAADIVGPGHHARGFAWAKERPRGRPKSDETVAFETYTPLEGDWYLFEELID